jgi:uncharacterized protein (TIGR00369 family)
VSEPVLPLDAAALSARLERSPFIRFLGLEVLGADAAAETVTMRMPMKAEMERGAGTGQFHGGAIAALIDTVGDYALIMKVGAAVPTINFRTDFLRPGTAPHLDAEATVRRAGKTVGVVDIDVLDAAGRLVAVGRGCYGMQAG